VASRTQRDRVLDDIGSTISESANMVDFEEGLSILA
jgi:hypothetical protein